ncbi:MAG: hypothetical protein WCD52_20155 [Xanthobacteraceae bacterium]
MASAFLDREFGLIRSDVAALLASSPALLGTANPTSERGVYMFWKDDEIKYVGEAKGSKGLRDRFSKHISGDDGHAIQRALESEFPNRLLRRKHMRETISARWLAIPDDGRISTVERLLIWLYAPPWNRK